jgi:hypothetical protein
MNYYCKLVHTVEVHGLLSERQKFAQQQQSVEFISREFIFAYTSDKTKRTCFEGGVAREEH